LLIGLLVYIGASLLCALATTIEVMIATRVLQGAGAAAASSIAFAICKDRFDGRLRQRIFVQLGIIVAAAPMIAPVIGGWIIELSSWRLVFVIQALLGLIAVLGVVRLEESLREPVRESMWRVYRGYRRLIGNRRFFLLTMVFACLGAPFFAFIAASSDIYITSLGYTERQYGYFFGFNASAFMLAPFVFSRLVQRFALSRLLLVSYGGMLLCSLLLLGDVIPQPFRLAVPMWLLTFFFAFGRPPSNNLILEQVEYDVGSASSLMVFTYFITGACSMWFISLGWPDKVLILGWFGLLSTTVTLIGWLLINRFYPLKMPYQENVQKEVNR
jgi:DHA1 family bicyclomycin/chloramphenicol resistance-like MFS transporter